MNNSDQENKGIAKICSICGIDMYLPSINCSAVHPNPFSKQEYNPFDLNNHLPHGMKVTNANTSTTQETNYVDSRTPEERESKIKAMFTTSQEKKCTCDGKIGFKESDVWVCGKCNGIVDQSPPQEKKCEHDVVAKYCFRCKRPDLAGTPPQHEEWMLKFEEIANKYNEHDVYASKFPYEIKDFISSLLKQEREKVIREILSLEPMSSWHIRLIEKYAKENNITLQEPNI